MSLGVAGAGGRVLQKDAPLVSCLSLLSNTVCRCFRPVLDFPFPPWISIRFLVVVVALFMPTKTNRLQLPRAFQKLVLVCCLEQTS
jgi:hypothetical protein